MWWFMTVCYGLSALFFIITAVGIIVTVISQGQEPWLLLYWVAAACLYFLTETCVIFYFVGTGVSVRDYIKDKGLDEDPHRRSVWIKKRVLPATMLNTLLMMTIFVSFGAVATHRMPFWLWSAVTFLALFHWVAVKKKQHWGFREMTRTILKMTNVSHPLLNQT